jgi:hypothetical protein
MITFTSLVPQKLVVPSIRVPFTIIVIISPDLASPISRPVVGNLSTKVPLEMGETSEKTKFRQGGLIPQLFHWNIPVPSKFHKANTVGSCKLNGEKDEKEMHSYCVKCRSKSELPKNAGRFMLYRKLLTRVWGPEYRDDVQILRTWDSQLRCKIEIDPNQPTLIRTVPQTGYIIEQPPC